MSSKKLRLQWPILLVLGTATGCLGAERTDTDLPVIHIGEADRHFGTVDNPPLMFGMIADVVVEPGGDIFVLDRQAARVVRLTEDGEIVDTYGRQGAGPGEFLSPAALALRGTNELLVHDLDRPGFVRLAIDDRGIRYLDTVTLTFFPWDICSFRDEIVVNALLNGHAIHVLHEDGDIIRSMYQLPHDLDQNVTERWQDNFREMKVQGQLLCIEPHTIVFLPEWERTLRAFTIQGEETWTMQVEGHIGLVWSETSRGAGFRPPEDVGWVHRARTVHALVDGTILGQFMRYGEAAGGREDAPGELRLFRPSDGTQISIPDTGRFISHIGDEFAWGWRNLPFPQVLRMPIWGPEGM